LLDYTSLVTFVQAVSLSRSLVSVIRLHMRQPMRYHAPDAPYFLTLLHGEQNGGTSSANARDRWVCSAITLQRAGWELTLPAMTQRRKPGTGLRILVLTITGRS